MRLYFWEDTIQNCFYPSVVVFIYLSIHPLIYPSVYLSTIYTLFCLSIHMVFCLVFVIDSFYISFVFNLCICCLQHCLFHFWLSSYKADPVTQIWVQLIYLGKWGQQTYKRKWEKWDRRKASEVCANSQITAVEDWGSVAPKMFLESFSLGLGRLGDLYNDFMLLRVVPDVNSFIYPVWSSLWSESFQRSLQRRQEPGIPQVRCSLCSDD